MMQEGELVTFVKEKKVKTKNRMGGQCCRGLRETNCCTMHWGILFDVCFSGIGIHIIFKLNIKITTTTVSIN